MTDQHVQSVASREAVLRSERLRIRIVLSSARSSRVGGCTSYPAAAIALGWRLTFGGSKYIFGLFEGLSIDRPSSFLPGIVAGMVAEEIRTQVEAAPRKAELRLKIDRLEHHLALVRPITQSLVPNHHARVKVLKSRDGTSLRITTGGDEDDWTGSSEP